MGASLYSNDGLTHWSYIWWLYHPPASLPSPEVKGWSWKFQPSNLSVGSLATSPYLYGLSKNHLINTNSGVAERGLLWITKDTANDSGNSKSLVALCQEPGTETKYVFLIIPQGSQTSGMNQCNPDLYSTLTNCSSNSGDIRDCFCPQGYSHHHGHFSNEAKAPGLARSSKFKSLPWIQGCLLHNC